MSLTNVFRKIDKINQKHQAIDQKYRLNDRSTSYSNDKYQQEVEDKRIYGYSGLDVLKTFNFKGKQRKTIKRPRTAFVKYRENQENNSSIYKHNKKQLHRAKSAQKSYCNVKNSQHNFLLREDIFNDRNKANFILQHEKNKTQNDQVGSIFKSTSYGSRKLARSSVTAHKKAKQTFIQLFKQNLIRQAQKKKIIKTKPYISEVVYQRQSQNIRNNKENIQTQKCDFFQLTKTIQKSSKLVIPQLQQSIKNIKEIRQSFSHSSLLDVLIKSNKIKQPQSRLQSDILFIFPQKFTFTIINIVTFQSLRIKIIKKQNQLYNDKTNQKIQFLQFFQKIITINNSSYVSFHHDNQLIYQQIIFSRSVAFVEKQQIHLLMAEFYIKMFLIFDNSSTIKSINSTCKMLLYGILSLPKQFIEFIQILKYKNIKYSDKSKKLYSGNLYQILLNSIKIIKNYQKQLKLNQKPTVVKIQKKKIVKKNTNNWMYFYICFSYIKISITMKIFHFLFLVLSYLLQPLFILLHLLLSEISYQFPRNFLFFLIFIRFIFIIFLLSLIYVIIQILFIFYLHLLTDLFPLINSLLNLIQIYSILLFYKISKRNPYMIIIFIFHTLYFRFQTKFLFPIFLFLSFNLSFIILINNVSLPSIYLIKQFI